MGRVYCRDLQRGQIETFAQHINADDTMEFRLPKTLDRRSNGGWTETAVHQPQFEACFSGVEFFQAIRFLQGIRSKRQRDA